MKINKLKLDKYGPLSDVNYSLGEGMNLFFGENESGKTLVVESIINMLLGNANNEFDYIDRVKNFNGTLVINKNGKEMVFPGEKFSKLFSNASPEDIRNAFIIRDFDLRIPKRSKDFEKSDYLRNITDRITGAETQKIDGIKEELMDIGFLTSTGQLSDRKPSGKIRTNREKAKKIKEEINDQLKEWKKEGGIQNFSEIQSLRKRREKVKEEITLLEKAKKVDKLRKGNSHLKTILNSEKELGNINDSTLGEYKELSDDIEKHKKHHGDYNVKLHKKIFVGSVGLLALSILASVFNPSVIFPILSLVFSVTSIYPGHKLWKYEKNKNKLNSFFSRAQEMEIEGDTLSKIENGLSQEIDSIKKEREELKGKKLQSIGALKNLFEENKEKIDFWKEKLEEYENSIENVDIEFDEKKLNKLKQEREDLIEEIDDINDKISKYKAKLSDFNKAISEIPFNRILDNEIEVISSIHDLDYATEELEKFIEGIDKRASGCKTTIEIFEEIENEEEEQINHLFEDDGEVVQFFKKVTDGNYKNVRYDEEKNSIIVTKSNREEITPKELSQGTNDLLYMSIRLKLANELLNDEPGFLILDDAFIYSDSNRIERELDILSNLADDGWQIIYFSFRKEVLDKIKSIDDAKIEKMPKLSFN